MYVACNRHNTVVAVSEQPFDIKDCEVRHFPGLKPREEWEKMIGSRLRLEPAKEPHDLRVGLLCNWNARCGISTYSGFLARALLPKVKELAVFSEKGEGPDEPFVRRCWERGQSMKACLDEIKAWAPDYLIIQHEFGIFPKATYFLQLLQGIDDIPYAVVMHSVYEHLDKAVCTAAVKNIIVHSQEGHDCLRRIGNNSKIFIIPHGCVRFKEEEQQELWNIFQTPYALVQFGFGFFYKGVDRVLEAIHHLKANDAKFKDIFYVYLCSESAHTGAVHAQYHDFLRQKIDDLGLQDNAVIIRKFHTEQTINHYLRTAKVALFPYVNDPSNRVYGASGAIRVAMANNIPVVASDCHLFDDLEGVVPRPKDHFALAKEIDEIFSNDAHRGTLLERARNYLNANTWEACADRYLKVYQDVY